MPEFDLKPPGNWEKEIARLKKRINKLDSKKDLVVLFGSSSIRLWVHAREDLKPHNVLNLGFGGSSYAWCRRYFNHLFEEIEPKRLMLYAGENDLSEGYSVQDVFDDFRLLVEVAEARFPDMKITVINVKPSPHRERLQDKFGELNEMYFQFIQTQSHYSYLDIHSAMLDNNGKVFTDIFLSDGLHMTRAGYTIWAREVKQFLDEHEAEPKQS